ncbi:MAG: hypothetical protein JW751_23105 [Polyangiaceae bacterium]|nr:hypothetical protein [Polyangiaceae bacterium]
MVEPRFNPSHTVEFDFERGLVAQGPTAPRVLLPADLLRDLISGLPESSRTDLGHRMGTELGRRVAEGLGTRAADTSIEGVVEYLGGELALTGLGSLGLERWGRALVMTIAGSPLGAPGDWLVARVVEGALQRLFGRDTRAVLLGRAGAMSRLLVVNPRTAVRVTQWLDEGAAWGEVLARLQEDSKPHGGSR